MLNLATLPATHLLNEADTAEVLDVKPGTLSVWRSTGRYPLPYKKIGRCVKYRVSDILEFIESRSRLHTGEGV